MNFAITSLWRVLKTASFSSEHFGSGLERKKLRGEKIARTKEQGAADERVAVRRRPTVYKLREVCHLLGKHSVREALVLASSRQQAEAETMLRKLLANGKVRASEGLALLRAAGFPRSAIHAAKRAIGVSTPREKNFGPYFWQLPEDAPARNAASPSLLPSAAEQTGTRPATTNTTQAFIATPLQREILKVLNGCAMVSDALEFKLKVDRRRLYYGGGADRLGGLKELVDRGHVVNNRRLGGYYRPDNPPTG